MKNIPKKIYLHIEDEWEVEDFEDAEVTWSDERISDDDIEYIISDMDNIISEQSELLKALYEKHYEETGYISMTQDLAEGYLKSQ